MGILQARILEWVAMPSSRGSQPRDQTYVFRIAGGFFAIWATREAQEYWSVLGWIGDLFSGGSYQPRNWNAVSCIAGRVFTSWAIREAPPLLPPFLISSFTHSIPAIIHALLIKQASQTQEPCLPLIFKILVKIMQWRNAFYLNLCLISGPILLILND